MGLTVGLVQQPRYRKDMIVTSEQQEIKQLRTKLEELERFIAVQNKLIEILKALPGNEGVGLDDESARKRLSRRPQRKRRRVAEDVSSREPEVSGKRDEAHGSHDARVEGALREASEEARTQA